MTSAAIFAGGLLILLAAVPILGVEVSVASTSTSNPASWPVGAYVDRDDPSIVFVFACAHAEGGKFSAIRVGGVWKPISLTCGDVAEDFKPVTDRSEVDALLKAARK